MYARKSVLEAAAQLLAQDPQASIEDIAHASGVGRATLYRWFSGREQLIAAIVEQVVAEAEEIMRGALAERGVPALEVLENMSRELLALGERYRFMLDSPGQPESSSPEAHTKDERLRGEFLAFIEGAQARGELREELPAEWIGSMFEGTILAACKDMGAERVTRLQAQRLVERTLGLLLGVG
jgi:AcrR family transcriptional regulator